MKELLLSTNFEDVKLAVIMLVTEKNISFIEENFERLESNYMKYRFLAKIFTTPAVRYRKDNFIITIHGNEIHLTDMNGKIDSSISIIDL